MHIGILKLAQKKDHPFWSYSAEIIYVEYIWHMIGLDWYILFIYGVQNNETTGTHQTIHAEDIFTIHMGIRDDPQYFVEVVYKAYVGYIELVVIYQA